RERGRQDDAVVGPDTRVLREPCDDVDARARAMMRPAVVAGCAMAAADKGQRRNPIADFQLRDILAERDDLAGEFVAHERAHRDGRARLRRHVQIAAADARAADPDYDFTRAGRRIGPVFDDHGFADSLEDGGFHDCLAGVGTYRPWRAM